MITRRGSSASTEARLQTVGRRARFQNDDPLVDEVEKGAVEDVDEADAGSQHLVDPVAPAVDQIEEQDSDQVIDGSKLL